jgi:AraC-like DNA-binding protein
MGRPEEGIILICNTHTYLGYDIASDLRLFKGVLGTCRKETIEYIGLCHAVLNAIDTNEIKDIYSTSADAISWLYLKKKIDTAGDSDKAKEYAQRITKRIKMLDVSRYGSDELIIQTVLSVKWWRINVLGEYKPKS